MRGCSRVFNEVYFALCCYWNCSQAPNRIRKWDGVPQTYSQSAQNWWKQCVLKGPRALKWWITSPQPWWIKLSLFLSDTGENGLGTLWNSETGLEQSGYKTPWIMVPVSCCFYGWCLHKVFLEYEFKWLSVRIYLFSKIICCSDGRRGIRSPSGQQEQR